MNRIFYLIGKSSSGKDFIFRQLMTRLELTPIILYTTRPMRENEKNGREYYFVSWEEFCRMRAENSVLEYRIYSTIQGDWAYFTAADSVDLSRGSCLGIGTPESYTALKKHFGDLLVPLYIEVEDGIRLSRALERERLELMPKYAEMCRRFLADSEDFSDEKLLAAGITKRFSNDGEPGECLAEILRYIGELQGEDK
ncbi:MAG: guanylate kinase [Ruminococcus sp.]|nr:guanylate kinase [Ruminococcus sp.]